jgi:response regulator RpfG family c-di-GMP phosphodiesterase
MDKWKILIVDDEPDVHTITSIILKDIEFKGKKIKMINAYSLEQAIEILKNEKDIALAIVDIVMENKNDGFKLIQFIRETLKNRLMRIVVRTGQPGVAPPREIILKYDINDYREKSEFSSNALFTLVISKLREYSDLLELYNQREILEEFANINFHNLDDLNLFFEKIKNILSMNINIEHSVLDYSDNGDKCDIIDKTLWKSNNEVEICIKAEKEKRLKYTIKFDNQLSNAYKNILNLTLSKQILNIENNILSKELIDNLYQIIYILSEITETRSYETGEHVKRVGLITKVIAKELGFKNQKLEFISTAAMLHDIGKIGIPDAILNKPTKLEDNEWEVMKQHTIIGYKILSTVDNPLFKMASNIALYHHENWDGSGYPKGLKGEEIPLEARIVALVDVYDALSTDRVYRKAWSEEKVLKYIKELNGKKFDPNIVEIFLNNYDEIKKFL